MNNHSSKGSKVDEILNELIGHNDGVEFGNGYHDECKKEVKEAKQALHASLVAEMPKKRVVTNENTYKEYDRKNPKHRYVTGIDVGYNVALNTITRIINNYFNGGRYE